MFRYSEEGEEACDFQKTKKQESLEALNFLTAKTLANDYCEREIKNQKQR